MNRSRTVALRGTIAGAVMLLMLAAPPAQAELPGGSYLQSCRDIHAFGDGVSAVCPRADGRWERTALRDVRGCAGGVANVGGRLACAGPSRQYGGMSDRDYRGWGNGYGSTGATPATRNIPPQDYGPRYFGGYNMGYGFGR